MLFKNILIVCVGNICRSPMAEALFKQAFINVNKPGCNVSSAGLQALVGYKADPIACQLMMKRGIDISGHRACQLHAEMIHKADLVFIMELDQKNAIIEKQQSARGKVFRLGEWGEFDIVDPYKKDSATFERSLSLIDQGISQWIKKL